MVDTLSLSPSHPGVSTAWGVYPRFWHAAPHPSGAAATLRRVTQERDADAPGYLIAGDALRALAALAVVGFHAEQGVAYGLGEPLRSDPGEVSQVGPWLAQGSAGVWVFFALSGYLVGGPWVRAWLRGTPRPSAGRYLSRRLRRLVPAFWVVLALVLVRFGTYDHDAGEVVRLFAFGQNTGRATLDGVLPQGWTLGCELAFYLALPLLGAVAAVSHRNPGPAVRRVLVFGGLVAVAAASLAFNGHDPAGDWSLTAAATAWAFVPGLLLAAVEDDLRPRLAGAGALAGRVVAVLLLAAAALILVGLAVSEPVASVLRVQYLHATMGGCLLAAALLWQWSTGSVPRPLRSRVAHALGTWSYGIYLVHIAAGREVRRHLPSGLSVDAQLAASLGGMVVGSILAAAVLWWLVEQPALTRRRPQLTWGGLVAPLRAPVARH